MRSGASCMPSSWVLLLLWHAKHRPAKPSHCARHRPCCHQWKVSTSLNQICHSRKRAQNPAFGVRGNQLDILGHHDHQQSHHAPTLQLKHKSSQYIQDTASNVFHMFPQFFWNSRPKDQLLSVMTSVVPHFTHRFMTTELVSVVEVSATWVAGFAYESFSLQNKE